MHQFLLRKKWDILSITLCTCSAFLLLFFLRNADDNRLTSWKWVFTGSEIIWFVPLIIAGIFLMYAVLNSPISRQKPSLFLFLFSFGVSALFWKVPEVIIDASRYFTYGKHLELYGIRYFISEWGNSINAWTDLPLVPFLYGLIFKLFGEGRAFIQVFTSVLFSMTVVVTYRIGKTLWDEETGFYAGALLLGIPYIFSQIPLMLVDVPTMFLLTLSIYVFMQALREGGGWIFLSALSIFAALLSKYSAWMMLSVIGIVFIVYAGEGLWVRGYGQKKRKEIPEAGFRDCLRRALFVTLIVSIFAGVVLYFKFNVIAEQIAFLREYQAPGLRRWGESFVSTFLFQIHPIVTLAALYSVYESIRKRDLKFLIVFWLILLIVVFQIRRSRYVMIVFPMVTLMGSYGLQKIKDPEIRRYLLSCAVAASLVVALFAYLPYLQTMSMVNFKDAGAFLDGTAAEKVEVLVIPSSETAVNASVAVPILDYFTMKDILYAHDENFSLPSEQIEKSPLRFTWTYRNPEYYISDAHASDLQPVVIISNRGRQELPERIRNRLQGYEITETFDATTDRFRYSPVVTVYLPAVEGQ